MTNMSLVRSGSVARIRSTIFRAIPQHRNFLLRSTRYCLGEGFIHESFTLTYNADTRLGRVAARAARRVARAAGAAAGRAGPADVSETRPRRGARPPRTALPYQGALRYISRSISFCVIEMYDIYSLCRVCHN